MPRLVNAATGVIVNVDEKTAAQLNKDWAPVKVKPKRAEPSKPE